MAASCRVPLCEIICTFASSVVTIVELIIGTSLPALMACDRCQVIQFCLDNSQPFIFVVNWCATNPAAMHWMNVRAVKIYLEYKPITQYTYMQVIYLRIEVL